VPGNCTGEVSAWDVKVCVSVCVCVRARACVGAALPEILEFSRRAVVRERLGAYVYACVHARIHVYTRISILGYMRLC
jgi:hypothetical protein